MGSFFRVILFLILTFIMIVFMLIFFLKPGSKNEISGSSKSFDSFETRKENKVGASRFNIIKEPVQEAAEVPKLYYKYLNEKNYDVASKLLGPSIAFYGDQSSRKYLVNLKQTTFVEYKDLSDTSKFGISRVQSDYYAVKAYYAKIDIEVNNPKLVPSIIGINYRLLLVVKETKDSPWLLDSDETMPPL